jgi:hypothetical protein
LHGIHRIRYELAQEDLVVGIQEFLNDGKDVLGMDGNGSFFLYAAINMLQQNIKASE